MRLINIILFLLFFSTVTAQKWNSEAGLIKPYTAEITASSGKNTNYINDQNPNTYWESGNPLPNAYISQNWNNLFLNYELFRINSKNTSAAFDGNTNTKASFNFGKTEISFKHPQKLLYLSVKADIKDTLHISIITSENKKVKLYYTPAENYQIKSYALPKEINAKNIILSSKKNFDIFELGALSHLPQEFVQLDLGKEQNIGWITTRQLNVSVRKITVLSSTDGNNWKKVLDLNPKAIPLLQIPLKIPFKARYIKLVYNLPFDNYVKARLWEFNIYGPFGPYGAPPPARQSKFTYAKTFGINTIWGWGYNVYSDLLKSGTGPGFFNKVAHQLRTYHRLDWDMKTPQNPPDFNTMAEGKGTPAEYWLNWDREYKNWIKYGFNIDVTLTFKQDNFPDSLWKDPVAESETYGKRFGNHFYNRQHLVQTIEIGNEPWNYNLDVYRKVLLGMSKGIKSVCNATVLPCAIQAWNPEDDNNNYINKYIHQKNALYLDGLNTHIYSYVFKENGIRVAVNPEDPRSEVWSMANLYRFRNINMPGKSIYVTEFGYDSNGGKEDCTHSECVSEINQAAYGIRMALILWRLGAEKLYWYYFANVQYSSFLHNRSGLCGSYATGFAPKQSFFAFEELLRVLGSYHFKDIIVENHQVYAYLFENMNTKEYLIIAWRPTSENTETEKWVQIPFTETVKGSGNLIQNRKTDYFLKNGDLNVKLSGLPVYFKINH
ncbi:MAG: discoidin domain-containing protein [Bacteroidales bacterium]|nr:discoidin domain-containing protein [Bacteroidales bacterium]